MVRKRDGQIVRLQRQLMEGMVCDDEFRKPDVFLAARERETLVAAARESEIRELRRQNEIASCRRETGRLQAELAEGAFYTMLSYTVGEVVGHRSRPFGNVPFRMAYRT